MHADGDWQAVEGVLTKDMETVGQGFSNFWCYGAHEEIDHNLRSLTINF